MSQATGLEMPVWWIMKIPVCDEVKNQSFRHSLIGLREPVGHITILCLPRDQVIRHVSRRQPHFVAHHRLDHLQKSRIDPQSQLPVPGICCRIPFPFFQLLNKCINLLARTLE